MKGLLQRFALVGLLAGLLSSAPIQAQGLLYGWGNNARGEVGDGSTINRNAPVYVQPLNGVTTVSRQAEHSAAIQDGALYTWGKLHSALGVYTATPLAPNAVPGMTSGVTSVVAAQRCTYAVKDGALYSWGSNGFGNLGLGDPNGFFDTFTPTPVPGMQSGVTAVAGTYHGMAIKDGALYGWGQNSAGDIGDGTQFLRYAPVAISSLSSGVTAISAGYAYGLAIKDGALYSWGWNTVGQLGYGPLSNIGYWNPHLVPGFESGVTAINAGEYHSLIVRNGQVYACGLNSSGQLGDGTTNNQITPTLVAGLPEECVAVAASINHSAALTASGRLFTWGANDAGQLGLGDFTNRPTPTEVFPPSGMKWVSVSDGGTHAIAAPANADPIADAGTDVTVPCEGPDGSIVVLDGSLSSDPDGDALEYEWSVAAGSGAVITNPNQAVASGLFPIGVHEVTLTVSDGNGGVAVDSVLITVEDDDPPVAMVTTDLASLWPANKKMVPVTITVQASDLCTAPEHLLVSCTVASNQADDTSTDPTLVGDVNGSDGYAAPVAVTLTNLSGGFYTAVINLRAERVSGVSTGRVYSINVLAIDPTGNVGRASTTVVVPHDKRN